MPCVRVLIVSAYPFTSFSRCSIRAVVLSGGSPFVFKTMPSSFTILSISCIATPRLRPAPALRRREAWIAA